MHREAEFGVAAHWRYKSKEEAILNGARRLEWFHNLQVQHEKMTTHMEFLEHLRRHVFDENLVVFNEAGQQLRFPLGATDKNKPKKPYQNSHCSKENVS